MNTLLKLLFWALLIGLLIFGVRSFTGSDGATDATQEVDSSDLFLMLGNSMEPTYKSGDMLIMDSNSTEVARGDVVVYLYHNRNGHDARQVARVLGLPGEKFQIKNGVIYVNNVETTISPFKTIYHVDSPLLFESGVIQLGFSEYYVVTDNTKRGFDSRYIGPISADDVIAKIVGVQEN